MKHVLFYTILCIAFVAMGCRGPARPEGMPDLLPVVLVIAQDGTPLTGASVMLAPAEETGERNWSLGGVTDESGEVVIRTHGKFAGAPKGTYKVFLRKTKEIGTISRDDAPQDDLAALRKWEADHAKELASIKTVSCIEKDYTSASTTPLEITVTKENSRFELNAGKAVNEEIKWTGPGMRK
ncbi:MAG: hypothetical protein Q4G68_04915 [Planctomycetia bacterium]|nr:hypothetical protein [Planctomycetia bacterium]